MSPRFGTDDLARRRRPARDMVGREPVVGGRDVDAWDRLGKTPREHLRWLLRFAGDRLDRMKPDELDAVSLGLQGLVLAGIRRGVDVGTMTSAPRELAMLRELQGSVQAAMLMLSTAQGAAWQPEGPAPTIVQTARVDSGRLVFRTRARFTDFRIGVLTTLGGLLLSCGDCVRRCPECGEAFVPVGRQKFCAQACQQRHFDRLRGEDRITKPPAFTLRDQKRKPKGGK